MNIYDKIKKDRMMISDTRKRSLLGVILSEIAIDGKGMDDKSAVQKLTQMRKGCTSNIDLYKTKENSTNEIRKEEAFIAVINKYLPAEAQVDDIKEAIDSLGIVTPTMKDISKVIKYLKYNFEIVDGALVKEILTKNE